MSFSTYLEYKDSGISWLGKIPAHWSVKRLKHLARHVTTRSEVNQSPIALEDIVAWTGKLVRNQHDYDGQGVSFEKGDLLFGKLRPYLAKVYLAEFDGTAIGDFHVVRPAEPIASDFLINYLLTKEFIYTVDSETYGAKMPRVGWETFGDMPCVVPPKLEQQVIVDFVAREAVKIDALIEEQQRLIELLKEKCQAVISHAVTKGLDPDAPMKDSSVEWLGEVPAHWDVVKIKRVAKLESGHTPSKSVPEYWENCTVPWVSLNDSKILAAQDYIEDTTHKINGAGLANSSAHMLPSETVVFTRDATIGLAAITKKPMAVSQHLIAWICGSTVLPEYLLLVLYAMEEELQRMTFGATIKTIGMPEVNRMLTPVPPMEEQKAIVEQVFEKRKKLASTHLEAEQMIGLLRERRAALISAAVTGKIDLRTWQFRDGCERSLSTATEEYSNYKA